MHPRAVVFDLWQTLATWPEDTSRAFRERWSQSTGVAADELERLWWSGEVYRQRESGPIRDALAALYRELEIEADIEEVVEWRLELTRAALEPDDGVLPTLTALRRRGYATGLISNCTEDVPLVWDDSPLSGLFDVAVFSATAGCVKPDRRIYELACRGLGVGPGDCLFVGDGANDELRGAERVGMTPVLIEPAGTAPRWDGLGDWDGLRIASIPEILELVA